VVVRRLAVDLVDDQYLASSVRVFTRVPGSHPLGSYTSLSGSSQLGLGSRGVPDLVCGDTECLSRIFVSLLRMGSWRALAGWQLSGD
jgi:hypothetical protein